LAITWTPIVTRIRGAGIHRRRIGTMIECDRVIGPILNGPTAVTRAPIIRGIHKTRTGTMIECDRMTGPILNGPAAVTQTPITLTRGVEIGRKRIGTMVECNRMTIPIVNEPTVVAQTPISSTTEAEFHRRILGKMVAGMRRGNAEKLKIDVPLAHNIILVGGMGDIEGEIHIIGIVPPIPNIILKGIVRLTRSIIVIGDIGKKATNKSVPSWTRNRSRRQRYTS